MSTPLPFSNQPIRHWLSHRDPRLKVIAALLFTITVVASNHIPVLITALSLSLLIAIAAGLHLPSLLKRLLILEAFMLILFLFLPFSTPGEALFSLGSYTGSWQGITKASAIFLKANAVVVLLVTLLGTLEPVTLGHTLASLKVPEKLVHLFLFTVRYIVLIHDEFQRLRLAMKARAFVPRSDRHTWRSAGWLLGMLLVRSHERAQRIQQAMLCRGFNGQFYLLDNQQWKASDSLFLLLWLTLLALLIVGEQHL